MPSWPILLMGTWWLAESGRITRPHSIQNARQGVRDDDIKIVVVLGGNNQYGAVSRDGVHHNIDWEGEYNSNTKRPISRSAPITKKHLGTCLRQPREGNHVWWDDCLNRAVGRRESTGQKLLHLGSLHHSLRSQQPLSRLRLLRTSMVHRCLLYRVWFHWPRYSQTLCYQLRRLEHLFPGSDWVALTKVNCGQRISLWIESWWNE